MTLETVIATELHPSGLALVLLSHLIDNEKKLNLENSVIYYGFPVFKDFNEQTIKTNFLLVSKKLGVVLLSTASKSLIEEEQKSLDDTYSQVQSLLLKSTILRTLNGKKSRNLVFEVDAKIFTDDLNIDDDDIINSIPQLEEYLIEKNEQLEDQHFNEIRSILEGSKSLHKINKRKKIIDDDKNKLNILINLEDEIINFDSEQRLAALTMINGPQRFRGLAGSGKTVILAMKVAHIHLHHPDKKILFTFYTKSLYTLVSNLINKFYRHFSGNEPDWEQIDILHAWGGVKVEGVYFNTCVENNIAIIPFKEARAEDPFLHVCQDLAKHKIQPKYDYILIDEAQDLPDAFFRICYQLAKGESGKEKNIVWAYDDLQTIFNIYTRSPLDLFGVDQLGNALIDLDKFSRESYWKIPNDIVLHKCYRNPLDVLVTAHALGFGIYDEPVQMMEDLPHWNDVGYELNEGHYKIGERVSLIRDPRNSPLSISQVQSKSEILGTYVAENLDDEVSYITKDIKHFIDQGLKPEDILVISLDDRNARHYFSKISYVLSELGILSNNILSSTMSNPPFILENMITLSTVHRAKGNEAACVFVLGIDAMFTTKTIRNTRNKIFTAFTRTKAWLRVSGIGYKAEHFMTEIAVSLEKSPRLEFIVPDKARIEHIQRDLNQKQQQIQELRSELKRFKELNLSKEEMEEELLLLQQMLGG